MTLPRLMLTVGPHNAAGPFYPLELVEVADGQQQSLALAQLPSNLMLGVAGFPAASDKKPHLESILEFYGAGSPDFENTAEKFPNIDGGDIRTQILQFYAKTKDKSKFFEPLGCYLHALLFPEPIATVWGDRTRPASNKQPILTVLAIEPKLVRGLPWELMVNERRRLFIDGKRPFARVLPDFAELDQEHQADNWPIRLLVVVGCNRNDPIEWRRELDLIESAVHEFGSRVDYLPLITPNHPEIIQALDEHQPHIFHFIGHGDKKQGDGYLKLDADKWELDEILQDFDQHCPDLRIAFVNCCHGNTTTGVEASWAVNEVFIRSKTRAVVGMQGDVLGEAAAEFSKKVYEKLSGGDTIDVAVAAARDDIRNYQEIGLNNREWSLPQLYLSCAADQVLKFSPQFNKVFEQQGDYSATKYHVNRYTERRSLYRLDAASCWLKEAQPHICVVTGTEGSGKSDFVRRCLAVCKLRGHLVSYLDFREIKGGTEKSDAYHLLQYIVKGSQSDLFREGLQSTTHPFHGFYQPAKRAGVNVAAADLGPQTEALTTGTDEPEAEMIRAFLAEVRSIAQKKPLVLVFDNVERHVCEQNYMRVLKDLAEAISPGHYAPLRLLLVGRRAKEDVSSTHTFTDFNMLSHAIPLTKFDRKQFGFLAEQFLCLHNQSLAPKLSHNEIADSIRLVGNRVPDPWDPGYLVKLVNLFR